MAERIDGYLSNKAQGVDRTALVVCQESPQNVSGERWILRRSGTEDLELGDRFSAARAALLAWLRAERARR
jgi:hypothetical protein